MRFNYQWTEREWKEAVRLADRRTRRRGTPLPGLMWPLIVIPLLGAIGDLVSIARTSHNITMRGSVVPLLLALLGASAALMLWAQQRKSRKIGPMTPRPQGEWTATLQEGGWRFAPAAADNTAESELLSPWSEVSEVRRGGRVIVLLRVDGFTALPTRVLSPEQGGHLHRLISRKVRPASRPDAAGPA